MWSTKLRRITVSCLFSHWVNFEEREKTRRSNVSLNAQSGYLDWEVNVAAGAKVGNAMFLCNKRAELLASALLAR